VDRLRAAEDQRRPLATGLDELDHLSLGGYVVVYVILIAVGVRLFLKEIRIGPGGSRRTAAAAGRAPQVRDPTRSRLLTRSDAMSTIQTSCRPSGSS
jgi:hypothetical protein